MTMSSVNPANGSIIHVFDTWDHGRIEKALALAERSFAAWSVQGFERRAACLHKAADLLHHRREHYAGIITLEMGKLHREALAEIDKCAWGCEYYADNAALFLADEPVETEAAKSAIVYQPLGCVLAIMPWNFPFWQVFRFAAPALMAGNTVLLKHASNVPHCAQAIEEVLRDAGVPEGVFQSMLVTADKVEAVIADRRVSAVTLTGSDAAGRAVAAAAGTHLKKAVLELGGSDAFVVLEDADLDHTVEQAVVARFQNAGQSCIAAKRFIVVDAIADRFVARFRDAVQALRHGDPMNEATTIGPLARVDLRDALHEQVSASIAAGAVPVTGCKPMPGKGAWYHPSILDHVRPGMPAFDEELFGPVAAVVRVVNEEQALAMANDSRYGLGGSVWTADPARGEAFARRLACGCAFVNHVVKSDPRLPFGGIRDSGHGRELSVQGMREFVNVKALWVG